VPAAVAVLLWTSIVQAEKRVSLVIGNSASKLFIWATTPRLSLGCKKRASTRRCCARTSAPAARVSDIPFYQATTLKLVIKLKTAKTLGITILSSVLARADEVIE
jgi:hypothetical protein